MAIDLRYGALAAMLLASCDAGKNGVSVRQPEPAGADAARGESLTLELPPADELARAESDAATQANALQLTLESDARNCAASDAREYAGEASLELTVPHGCVVKLRVALGHADAADGFAAYYATPVAIDLGFGAALALHGDEGAEGDDHDRQPLRLALKRTGLGAAAGYPLEWLGRGLTKPEPAPEPEEPVAPPPQPAQPPQPPARPADGIVAFHIPEGTGSGAWNSAETEVVAKVGETIRIYNDDTVVHQLHTNFVPCPHGTRIAPGAYWDCRAATTFQGPLYDHNTHGLFHFRVER